MTEQSQRSNLGRGLSALFGEEPVDAGLDRDRATKEVPVEKLHANSRQPRQHFDEGPLEELAQSIRKNGLLQPILVRPHPEQPSEYEIVAGERRWRAAQKAQIHQVPVVIRRLSDSEALEVALVENLQREDLSVLEEAAAFQRLTAEYGHSPEQLGQAIGKSRSHVANTLRLLGLPDAVRALLESAALSAGHARALLNAKNPEVLAKQVVKKDLTVRQTEALVRQQKQPSTPAPARGATGPIKDADTLALERDLIALLGLKVTIDIGKRGGAITIHYNTLEQLDDVLQRLSKGSASTRL